MRSRVGTLVSINRRDLRHLDLIKRKQGEWRKLHNEYLHNLYLLPSITAVIRSSWMRQPGYVALRGRVENCIKS